MHESGLPIILISGKNNNSKSLTLLDFSSPTSWIDFKQAQEYNINFLNTEREYSVCRKF